MQFLIFKQEFLKIAVLQAISNQIQSDSDLKSWKTVSVLKWKKSHKLLRGIDNQKIKLNC